MKTLLLSALVALATTPAFAGSFSGELATKMRLSLSAVGAKTQMSANKRVISVSGVRCSYTVSREGNLASCEMQDEVAGRVIRVSDRGTRRGDKREVAELIRAMRLAGAKMEDRMGGGSVDAREITCQLSFKLRTVRSSCFLRK